jgi:hypothetical protein
MSNGISRMLIGIVLMSGNARNIGIGVTTIPTPFFT